MFDRVFEGPLTCSGCLGALEFIQSKYIKKQHPEMLHKKNWS